MSGIASGKRPSLSDVANLAGVSRSTASLVLRDAPGPGAASRKAVFDAAAALDYRPDRSARALALGRSQLLGVLFSMRDSFHADLIDAIYPSAESAGYEVVLSGIVPGRGRRRALDALIDSRCAAVIQLGSDAPSGADGEALPVVAVGWHSSDPAIDSVRTADAVGIAAAVGHLVDLGHRSIVHIDAGRRAGSVERRRGYRSAMRKYGVADEIRIVDGDYTEESGARAAELLLSEAVTPSALVAANDRMAVGALDTFRRAGVEVPGDISIVGYDDSQISRMSHIDLTTVRQDAAAMAELAVQAAVSRLEQGRTEALDLRLDPHLVVRATTAAPRERARGR